MPTICLLSAKGSPGVTCASVGLALAWPVSLPGRRSLLVDADPSGGDTAAGVLRGGVPAGAGMMALATSRLLPAAAVDAVGVALSEDGAARLVPGVPDGARAAALPLAWDRLVAAGGDLEAAGTDLIVDAGRHDPTRPPGPRLVDADLAVLVVRPTLPAVTAAKRLVTAWSAGDSPTADVQLRLLVVDSPSPYGAGEVAAAVGLPLVGVLPHQPEHARVHAEGAVPGRGFARSAYVRALHHLARDLEGALLRDTRGAGVSSGAASAGAAR